MAATDAQKRAIKKFEKDHIKQITIKLNIRTDADIIEHLNSLSTSKLGYIKQLIRKDIANNSVQ